MNDAVMDEADERAITSTANQFFARANASDAAEEWSKVIDLGWTSLGVPEDLGGAGFGHRARGLIAEAAGRALGGGWLWPDLGLALPLAVALEDRQLTDALVNGARVAVAWRGQEQIWLSEALSSPVLRHENGIVNGSAEMVLGAAQADFVVAVARDEDGPGLWLLRGDALVTTSSPEGQVDLSALARSVAVHGDATKLARGERAEQVWRQAGRASSLWLAAESLGLARHTLDLAVTHARERSQFGRPIGSFQAISHPLANLFADIVLAGAAVDWAAQALDAGDPDADRAVFSASLLSHRAAVASAEQAIQVLGGLGMTWESPVHRYLKRALAIGALDGGARVLRRRLASALFPTSDGGVA